ncbi:unnamed protein product [Acidithrix sp. C25]|nr:unnamed protein product [Acidithrix sp. C25]
MPRLGNLNKRSDKNAPISQVTVTIRCPIDDKLDNMLLHFA